MKAMANPIVIVESPYTGNIDLNLEYVRAAMHDCFKRGEIPFASHALYTQPGVLDDLNPMERALGITAGYAFWPCADVIAFYVDLGWSQGMLAAKARAARQDESPRVEERTLPAGWRHR